VALRLRRATDADARRLWEWRTDPTTRANSLSAGPADWDEHVSWLTGSLASDIRLLYIAEHDGRAVGQVRLDRVTDGWEVSITVAPDARGSGHGVAMLRAVDADVDDRIIARIKRGNTASIRCFEKAGYRPVGSGHQEVVEYERPARDP
jgi:RimJ/RimL family protein N-acetyltransferase